MQQYEKHVKDALNDSARVWTCGGYVGLQYPEGLRNMAYTPEQARRLARALKRAANVAEGKPAKAKKAPKVPTEFRDGDGDYWYLSPNGFYGIDAPSDTAHRSIDSIIDAYGTWGGERP